jgi:hypothetical protein
VRRIRGCCDDIANSDERVRREFRFAAAERTPAVL